ncbi:trypsin-like serine protease [Sorangium cellulosum]|uniref:Peptidase S1 domain-containing protein n=1 Tax=Sorangium cellulosum TaxID=56 RepID=A0A150QKB7_SORCE|nr:trypsin-like serine protease [Sorangium cellulosum]KYF68431.1 hypothetical protein BE15_10545 [Sorangium cellulosum]
MQQSPLLFVGMASAPRWASLLFVQWDWMAVTTLLGLGDATHHTCTGDSGGPALMNVNRVPTITGVASFSTTGDFTLCTDGWDVRVDLYLDFIGQFVSAP